MNTEGASKEIIELLQKKYPQLPGDQSIYMVPAIGMAEDVLVKIANSFTDFESEMGKELDEA